MSSYRMSSEQPCMTPCEDLLASVGAYKEDTRNSLPPERQWVHFVADKLGYFLHRFFPIYWDGQGCYILYRENSGADRYLALVNLVYDQTTAVAIPDEAALLQFYTLIQPFLMVESAKRFRDRGDDGYWNDGKSWKAIVDKRAKDETCG